MRIDARAGLWSFGPTPAQPPAVAVLEVAGAVLEWTVDDPAGVAATFVTVTDVAAAQWLWRLVGAGGHAALVDVLGGDAVDGSIDLPGIEPDADALIPLRRLALGHWARRWWPGSLRDGIPTLDAALLDAEVALLAAAAQDYFDDDALDADVAGLLASHQAALLAHRRDGDPRVVELVDACAEVAEDAGVWDVDAAVPASARRADYALAAGGRGGRAQPSVASGVSSIDWAAVPAGLFDAADDTVAWRVDVTDTGSVATVRVATAGTRPAAGVPVRLRSGPVSGAGVLDEDGLARFDLAGETGPVVEVVAWNHDWAPTTVSVGADVDPAPDADVMRRRIRDYARGRLARPGADAFLAEILAAEADY